MRHREEPLHVGIVVPVHDEEQLIGSALCALDRSVTEISGRPVVPGIVIVLDGCRDRSEELVARWRRRELEVDGRRHIQVVASAGGNVGRARRLGCEALLGAWSDVAPERIWLATTDADSEVPADWITSQVKARSEGSQVWVGGVSVHDWDDRPGGTAEVWQRQYAEEHLPIHGANLGIDADTYLKAGGFSDLTTGEDRDLVLRTAALGAVICRHPSVRVATSGRRQARAPDGFARALTRIEAAIAGMGSTGEPEFTPS
jgi:hypothetical protein